jgi:quinol monooxygenase YgiN
MIAVVDALSGRADELRAAVVALTLGCRAEPGCVLFEPYEDAGVPGRFHLVEIYVDTDAFRAHLTTEHVRRFWAALATCSSNRGPDRLTQLVTVPTS